MYSKQKRQNIYTGTASSRAGDSYNTQPKAKPLETKRNRAGGLGQEIGFPRRGPATKMYSTTQYLYIYNIKKHTNRVTIERINNHQIMQKLSATAARDKAARDKAFAMTRERKDKKAHAQRKHREDPSGDGKDWDHKDKKWKSTKANRGNDGDGTKKESGKRYKI